MSHNNYIAHWFKFVDLGTRVEAQARDKREAKADSTPVWSHQQNICAAYCYDQTNHIIHNYHVHSPDSQSSVSLPFTLFFILNAQQDTKMITYDSIVTSNLESIQKLSNKS